MKDAPQRGVEHHVDARLLPQHSQRRDGVARVLSLSHRLIMRDVARACLRILGEDAEDASGVPLREPA
jgi:hypothetical protein